MRRADDKLDQGDYLGALRLERRALELVPFDSADGRDIRLMLADTYLDMNCSVEAAAWCAPLLRPDIDEFRPAMLRLGHCLASRGEFTAALDAFELSVSGDGSSPALPLEDSMNAMECIEFCEQYLADEITAEPALRDLDEIESERIADEAAALGENSKFTEAIALLEEGREKYPDSARLFADLLINYYCERRYLDALRIYDDAPEKLKNDFTVQCCITMLFFRLGQGERMEEARHNVLEFGVTDPNDVVRVYTVMMETEHYDTAVEYAEKLLAQEPYNRTFMHFLAHACYEKGEYEQAQGLYDRCLVIEPHDSAARYYKSVCAMTAEDGTHRSFQTDYSVPHSEFLERCKFTERLVSCARGELETIWNEERDRILTMVDWALTDRNCPFGDLYLVLMLLMDPELAETYLRRLLVEPDCSPVMRRLSAAHLQAFYGMNNDGFRFVMLNDEHVRICALRAAPGVEDYPESYRKIHNAVNEELAKVAPELLEAGLAVVKLYTLTASRLRQRLPYGQSEAMAAAIVYYMLSTSEHHETPELGAFAAAHGVTPRRIENALKRLLELPGFPAPSGENGDTDGDGDE